MNLLAKYLNLPYICTFRGKKESCINLFFTSCFKISSKSSEVRRCQSVQVRIAFNNDLHFLPDRPVCHPATQRVFEANKLQEVRIDCSVLANPTDNLIFSWSFNNSINSLELPVIHWARNAVNFYNFMLGLTQPWRPVFFSKFMAFLIFVFGNENWILFPPPAWTDLGDGGREQPPIQSPDRAGLRDSALLAGEWAGPWVALCLHHPPHRTPGASLEMSHQ